MVHMKFNGKKAARARTQQGRDQLNADLTHRGPSKAEQRNLLAEAVTNTAKFDSATTKIKPRRRQSWGSRI